MPALYRALVGAGRPAAAAAEFATIMAAREARSTSASRADPRSD